MKLFLLLWPCAVISTAFASIPRVPVELNPESAVKIRVRVSPAVALAALRGFDLRIYDQARGEGARPRLAAEPSRQSEWELRCFRGQVRASRVDGTESELELKPPVAIGTPAGFLSLAGKPYRGQLVI